MRIAEEYTSSYKGRDTKETYTFFFTSEGELEEIKLTVYRKSSTDQYHDRMLDNVTVTKEDVPNVVLASVNGRLNTMAEEL
jgi:hypothetical protein